MQSKVVLVVEDDPDHRLISTTLLRHHGYAVLEAEDGAEAVRVTRAHQPDLVLMDARLPALDGWSVTRELKGDLATRAIPIIMLTAHTPTAARERSAEAGCDLYLVKPMEPSLVVDEVRRLIGEPSASRHPVS